MTYEEFKGELFRIIMQQEEVPGRRIMLLERGYTSQDSQMLAMIRYINRVTFGREDNVIHGDYIHVVWGNGTIRSMMNWDVREYYERYRVSGWQGVVPVLLTKIQRCGRSTDWLYLGEGGYEKTKEKLIIRPINYLFNQYELEESVYWRCGDIALTLYGIVCDEEDEFMTMKMKREITGAWNRTDAELLTQALQNTERLMPPRLYPSTALKEHYEPGEGAFMPQECSCSLEELLAKLRMTSEMEGSLGYRLTTAKTINGAVAYFYPGVKERLAELMGDYYIGFTSIHEAIIHPVARQSPDSIRRSIRQINLAFPREEMLTGRIYQYLSGRKELVEV